MVYRVDAGLGGRDVVLGLYDETIVFPYCQAPSGVGRLLEQRRIGHAS
jgi:hypothetical protein